MRGVISFLFIHRTALSWKQVTRFKCGGLTVALTGNHMLADGQSVFDFTKAWSDFSRTNTTDKKMDYNRAKIDPSNQASIPGDTFVNPPPSHIWAVKCYEVNIPSSASAVFWGETFDRNGIDAVLCFRV